MKKSHLLIIILLSTILLILSFFIVKTIMSSVNNTQEIIEEDIEEIDLWQEQYDLGVKYLNDENYDEAIIAFETAIEIDPKKAEPYIMLANIYIILDDIDSAINILKQGLEEIDDESLSSYLEELQIVIDEESEAEETEQEEIIEPEEVAPQEETVELEENIIEEFDTDESLLLTLAGTEWKLDSELFFKKNHCEIEAVFGSLIHTSNSLSFNEDGTFFMGAGGASAAGGGSGTYSQNGDIINYQMVLMGFSGIEGTGTWEIVEINGQTVIYTTYVNLFEDDFIDTSTDYDMYWIQQ